MKLLYAEYQHHLDQLIQAALNGSDPAECVKKRLSRRDDRIMIGDLEFDVSQGRVFLIGIGKASVAMGKAVAEILAGDLHASILITKNTGKEWGPELSDSPLLLRGSSFTLFESGHPIPDSESVNSASAVEQLLADATESDLVICLISGGASALFSQPLIPLSDWQMLNQALLKSGCTINELNHIRQRLDRVKGGGLAKMAAPAVCVSLILSDVVGNRLETIGSGPTVHCQFRDSDAMVILEKYGLPQQLPEETWNHIQAAMLQPIEDDPVEYSTPYNLIVGDVRSAANASLIRAAQLGFVTQLLTTHLQGEAREVGTVTAAIAKDLQPGRCLILGGETTVIVKGTGRGGRNQELALAAALGIDGMSNVLIASFATDGEDGIADAAGAVATGETIARSRAFGLDAQAFLANNDSYTFFSRLDEQDTAADGTAAQIQSPPHLIRTGSTGTNVNDLIFILKYPSPGSQR